MEKEVRDASASSGGLEPRERPWRMGKGEFGSEEGRADKRTTEMRLLLLLLLT